MAWYQPIPLFFGNIFSVDRAGKGLSNSTIYITYIISPFCLSCGIFGPFLTLLYTQTPFLALSGEFFFRIKFADSSLKGGGWSRRNPLFPLTFLATIYPLYE